MNFTKKASLYIIFFLVQLHFTASAKGVDSSKFKIGFQQTMINQYAVNTPHMIGSSSLFPATGNTFSDPSIRTSYTATAFIDYFINTHFLIHCDPEITDGSGVGNALGMAGYVNGEVVRVGYSPNILSVSRLYLQYKSDYFNIKLGKISFVDMFCNSDFSHDPRTSLMNWSMMTAGAWDFCGNTKGYTYAFVIEAHHKNSDLKFGVGVEPTTSNGLLAPYQPLDMSIAFNNGFGYNLEYDHNFLHKKLKTGLLVYLNHERGAEYSKVVHTKATDDSIINNVSESLYNIRNFGNKYGFVFHADYAINDNLGVFSYLSWNDGQREIWAFAEIDRSLCLGLSYHINKNSYIYVGYALNGISAAHAKFLEGGGYTFMLRDAGLNYGLENVLELQYNIKVHKHVFISPDYQVILHPGYNMSNGIVNVFGVRSHFEF